MIELAKAGNAQKRILFITTIATRMTVGLLSKNWSVLGNSQHWSILISTLLTAVFSMMCYSICRRYSLPLNLALKKIFGKKIMRVVYAMTILFLIISAQNVLNTLGSITSLLALPTARLSAIALFAVTAACFGALKGFRAIARYSRLMVLLMTAGLLIAFLLSLRDFSFNFLFPLFGNGVWDTVLYGFRTSGDMFGIIILACLYDPDANPKENRNLMLSVPLIAGFICYVFYLSTALSFPYTVKDISPLFDLISSLSVGRYLQSLTAAFIFVWNSAFLITMAQNLLFTGEFFKEMIPSLKNTRPVVILTALLVLGMSLVPRSTLPKGLVALFTPLPNAWVPLYLPLVVAFILSFIIRKKEKSPCPNASS